MVREMIGLGVSAARATVLPWMIPVVFSALGGLLIVGYAPLFLLGVVVFGAVCGTTLLRFTNRYCIARCTKRFGDRMNNNKWMNNKWIKGIHEKLTKTHNTGYMFLIVLLTTWSQIPDIVLIEYCRGKIALPLFIVATAIGKSIVYIPIIYGIELLRYLT